MQQAVVLSRWTVALLLALAIPFVPLPHALVAVSILALQPAVARGTGAQRLAIVSLSVLALPFVGDAVSGGRAETAALVLAGLPWLLETIKDTQRAGRGQDLVSFEILGRRPTSLLAALAVGDVVAVIAALMVGHLTLAVAAAGLLAFLTGIVAVSLVRLRPQFMRIELESIRALAGETVQAGAVVVGDPRVRGRVRPAPGVPWAHVVPEVLEVGSEPCTLSLTLTPPLAGSGAVAGRLAWIDPWGLTGAIVDRPIAQVRVIPRAAYAAWFARRYLENSRGGDAAAVVVAEAHEMRGVRRGLEYYGARHYEAGDTLRDILWKQTSSIRQLVVKDRRDDLVQAGILAVRLTGRDADEADRIAYNLLMAALTLAQEGIPIAFAPYTSDGPEGTSSSLDPTAAVRHALRLAEQVRVAPASRRLLGPAHPGRLRRTLSRLRQAESLPARRLAGILSFELRALQSRARAHPATAALSRAAAAVGMPAIVVVISPMADDAEILNLTLEGLAPRGLQRMDLLTVTA